MRSLFNAILFTLVIIIIVTVIFSFPLRVSGAESAETSPAVSEATEECLGCHEEVTPQIVADWKTSRHSRISFAGALKKDALSRRVSAEKVADNLSGVVVGCAECHTLFPDSHKDTFAHGGYKVHVVVSPADCAICHPVEQRQYSQNKMAHAYGNLVNNSLYRSLMNSINHVHFMEKGKVKQVPAPGNTDEDSCLACHGTKVEVKEFKQVETDIGEMTFPILSGWPNQGVGRINPDGTMGACTTCHPRHGFSIEVARKPYTCSQCHSGPDVPSYKVYGLSKHGNIYSALHHHWNFEAVPWTVGKDFTAPTCAACHISLLTTPSGDVVANRSHRMNDRLPWRLFGLVYSHPEPKSADTSIIKNKAGLPLPTELTGQPASEFLIDKKEEEQRLASLKSVCRACHTTRWVNGHFVRLKNTLKETDKSTLTATQLLLQAWEKGVASGPEQKDGIFNELIERYWVRHWLFYANSIRFASAMMGVDYGVFHNGRWQLTRNIEQMKELLKKHSK